MNGKQIESGSRTAVEGRTTVGLLPILLEVAVPVTRLALLDEEVIVVLNGGEAASHTLCGGGSTHSFQFPGAPTQRFDLAQVPQAIIKEKILPGFEQWKTLRDALLNTVSN